MTETSVLLGASAGLANVSDGYNSKNSGSSSAASNPSADAAPLRPAVDAFGEDGVPSDEPEPVCERAGGPAIDPPPPPLTLPPIGLKLREGRPEPKSSSAAEAADGPPPDTLPFARDRSAGSSPGPSAVRGGLPGGGFFRVFVAHCSTAATHSSCAQRARDREES
jgi:hypothetical protein